MQATILRSCGNYPVQVKSSDEPQCDFNGWKNSIIAQRDISPGEILYREKYFLISTDNGFNNRDLLRSGIEEKLSSCSIAEKTMYRELRSLTNLNLHRDHLDVSIALTHSIKINKACGIDWSCSLDSSCINLTPLQLSIKTSQPLNFVGVFLCLGFMPHSCSPNSTIDIDASGTITVRSNKQIRAGESVTRSWIPDVYLSRLKRSHEFSSLFGDRMCRCECCVRAITNLPVALFDDTLRLRIREKIQYFSRLAGCGTAATTTTPEKSQAPSSSSSSSSSNTTSVLRFSINLIRLLEHSYLVSFGNALMLSRLHLRISALQMKDGRSACGIDHIKLAAGYAILAQGREAPELTKLLNLLTLRCAEPCAVRALPVFRYARLSAEDLAMSMAQQQLIPVHDIACFAGTRITAAALEGEYEDENRDDGKPLLARSSLLVDERSSAVVVEKSSSVGAGIQQQQRASNTLLIPAPSSSSSLSLSSSSLQLAAAGSVGGVGKHGTTAGMIVSVGLLERHTATESTVTMGGFDSYTVIARLQEATPINVPPPMPERKFNTITMDMDIDLNALSSLPLSPSLFKILTNSGHAQQPQQQISSSSSSSSSSIPYASASSPPPQLQQLQQQQIPRVLYKMDRSVVGIGDGVLSKAGEQSEAAAAADEALLAVFGKKRPSPAAIVTGTDGTTTTTTATVVCIADSDSGSGSSSSSSIIQQQQQPDCSIVSNNNDNNNSPSSILSRGGVATGAAGANIASRATRVPQAAVESTSCKSTSIIDVTSANIANINTSHAADRAPRAVQLTSSAAAAVGDAPMTRMLAKDISYSSSTPSIKSNNNIGGGGAAAVRSYGGRQRMQWMMKIDHSSNAISDDISSDGGGPSTSNDLASSSSSSITAASPSSSLQHFSSPTKLLSIYHSPPTKANNHHSHRGYHHHSNNSSSMLSSQPHVAPFSNDNHAPPRTRIPRFGAALPTLYTSSPTTGSLISPLHGRVSPAKEPEGFLTHKNLSPSPKKRSALAGDSLAMDRNSKASSSSSSFSTSVMVAVQQELHHQGERVLMLAPTAAAAAAAADSSFGSSYSSAVATAVAAIINQTSLDTSISTAGSTVEEREQQQAREQVSSHDLLVPPLMSEADVEEEEGGGASNAANGIILASSGRMPLRSLTDNDWNNNDDDDDDHVSDISIHHRHQHDDVHRPHIERKEAPVVVIPTGHNIAVSAITFSTRSGTSIVKNIDDSSSQRREQGATEEVAVQAGVRTSPSASLQEQGDEGGGAVEELLSPFKLQSVSMSPEKGNTNAGISSGINIMNTSTTRGARHRTDPAVADSLLLSIEGHAHHYRDHSNNHQHTGSRTSTTDHRPRKINQPSPLPPPGDTTVSSSLLSQPLGGDPNYRYHHHPQPHLTGTLSDTTDTAITANSLMAAKGAAAAAARVVVKLPIVNPTLNGAIATSVV